jgi:hypothetical protein
MPRRRVAAAAGGIAAVAGLLSACDKPTPLVTVLAGNTVTRIQPQTYCFDTSHCRINSGTIRSIKASSGSAILVDVPRNVAGKTWEVQAVTPGTDGKFTSLKVDGASSGTISGRHSTRVQVPYGQGAYYLLVTAGTGTSSPGSWVAKVTVTSG